ncbi:MAG: cation:proton antiporter [Clostridiales bacterium]|nr:cation:proton antiporter [Clostridiales bacterium]
MKKFISLLLIACLGAFIFISLYFPGGGTLAFPYYGDVDLNGRVSQAYIDKSVNGPNDVVVYGESTDEESGSANMVTSIVVDYRSFDTLGEVTVLLVSTLGVGILLGGKRKRLEYKHAPNFILKHGARLTFGLLVVFGVYMFAHGHLTPGGGFPGGSIIAAAILLLYLADDEFRVKLAGIKIAEGTAGSLYVIIGLAGLATGGYFLYNFLPNGTVGKLFSAGIIPIVYALIGLKVGSEISGAIDGFATEEVAE